MGQEQLAAARSLGFEIRNPQRFARNMARLMEEAVKAAAVFMQPHTLNPTHYTLHDDLAPALATMAQLQRAWLQQPYTVLEAQGALWISWFDLAAQLGQRVRTAVWIDSWYRKSRPTFADALAAVRQAIWRETGLLTSRHRHNMPKPSQALQRCLIYALCRAA